MADEQKTEIENTESLETKQEEQVVEQQETMISQAEVDKIVENRLARQRKQYEKKYAGIDPEEARKLIEEQEQQAIKPDQVVNLLRGKVQLGEDGKPEIIGDNNAPIYNDKGELISIDEYVGKFLDDNPHFRTASPSGSGSAGNVGGTTKKPFNLSELNMNDPNDRQKYAEYRAERNKKPTVINLT